MEDKSYLERISKIMEERRASDPAQVEWYRLLNEMFPISQVQSMYCLGFCNAFAVIKNGLYPYFCKEDRALIDRFIQIVREDEESNRILKKLLKEKE